MTCISVKHVRVEKGDNKNGLRCFSYLFKKTEILFNNRSPGPNRSIVKDFQGRNISPEACGEDAKACDAMREGPTWITIPCAVTRATASVHADPHSSDNVHHGLQVIPR